MFEELCRRHVDASKWRYPITLSDDSLDTYRGPKPGSVLPMKQDIKDNEILLTKP
jgi:hypothetical protein